MALPLLVALVLAAAGPAPEPEWRTVEWCGPGIRLEVPTFGRALDVSLFESGGRIQNYRIEELRPLSDGFYELRPGDYFLEMELLTGAAAPAFPAGDCAEPPRPLDGHPGSSWCRVGVELGGEASYTHIARVPVAGGLLDLDLDASALPALVPESVFASVETMGDACPAL